MKFLFSIRIKFLFVMSVLLLASVGIYLLIAIKVFRTDKTELVFDLNRSMVSNLSTEIETQLGGVSDQFKLFALSFNSPSVTKSLFSEDSEVVAAFIYSKSQTDFLKSFVSSKYLETYGLPTNYFEGQIPQVRPVPFDEITKRGEFLWNATLPEGTPLVGYGRNIVVENARGVAVDHMAVVGYINPVKILKSLSLVSLSEVSVVDAEGHLIIHENPEWLRIAKSYVADPLFEFARNSKVTVSVSSLKDSRGPFLGAFARSYGGQVYVLARAPESKVFSAVEDLVSESLLFALIVFTVSLLFAMIWSRSLTDPISALVEGMKNVANGDLSTHITIKTRDETLLLANSFNHMIQDLKQSRDELHEINRDLDRKVQERTHQLEIQSQAVKEAQEALLRTTRLASAGEIAGHAAHEVLNPLTAILTRVHGIQRKVTQEVNPQFSVLNDILKSWKEDQRSGGFEQLLSSWKKPSSIRPDQNLWDEDLANVEAVQRCFSTLLSNLEKDIGFLLHEGGRINKIIDGMRKLNHVHSDIKVHSAQKLLVDCRNIMADLFNQRHIQIEETFDPGPDLIETDRDEFIQALTNLMRNSLQAMVGPKSAPETNGDHHFALRISTRIHDHRLWIEISDNGPGIPSQYHAKLFESQFTTKSPDEGTGLGLGISRRFIRAHGGEIEFVSSKPYQETLFRIHFPLKEAVSEEQEPTGKEGAA